MQITQNTLRALEKVVTMVLMSSVKRGDATKTMSVIS